MDGLLKGVRVLEVGRVFAAPLAGQMLADLGAEVIKVEALGSGDLARDQGIGAIPDADGKPTSDHTMFAALNRNKQSIAVDIGSPKGQDIVRRLAAHCDVFIENFKVGDLARKGLDYETIAPLNPRLIYLSLSGFGQTGPYRARPGIDTVAQGVTGMMSLLGAADGPPAILPVTVMDFSAGMHAANAILAALYGRDANGGTGQYIDLALLDSALAVMGVRVLDYMLTGVQPQRGARNRGWSPSGMFEASDGWLQLSVGPDADFERFCKVFGLDGMRADPRFATREGRWEHQEDLVEQTREILRTRVRDEVLVALETAGVLCAPVNDFAATVKDPQLEAREMFMQLPHAKGGLSPSIRNPIRFSKTPIERYDAPPLLGADTDDVLERLLGLSGEDISALREAKAVG